MENRKPIIGEENKQIDQELRLDGGRNVQWVAPDGTVRIPQETQKDYFYPGPFFAAGRPYASWKNLCVKKDATGHFCKDMYGRDVFCMSERFPCFDSYDYANETRYYRWFFIKEKGKLTRVYHADGRNKIQVTEDVASLENVCRRKMEELGWL